MTNKFSLFDPFDVIVNVADMNSSKCEGRGDIKVNVPDGGDRVIMDVLHVPGLAANLL